MPVYRDFPITMAYREIPILGRFEMARYTARLHSPADFGRALQQARLARGMSQQSLAEELGLPQSTISEFETGKSTIYLRRLLTLASATGVEFNAAWGDDDASRG